jgi:hypothetical protein
VIGRWHKHKDSTCKGSGRACFACGKSGHVISNALCPAVSGQHKGVMIWVILQCATGRNNRLPSRSHHLVIAIPFNMKMEIKTTTPRRAEHKKTQNACDVTHSQWRGVIICYNN